MTAHTGSETLATIAWTGTDPPAHVATCAACREDLASYRTLVTRLRSLPAPPEALDQAASYFDRRRRLDGLVERLAEDPALRARLGRDPAAVLRDAGVEPTGEMIAALADMGRGEAGAGERIAASLWF